MARRPRPARSGLCAICDQTNDTTDICGPCWNDPANADWVTTWETLDDSIELRPAAGRLAELADKKLRDATELQAQIVDLAIRGTFDLVPYVYRGRRHGRRKRYRAFTAAEIAQRVGCSVAYVARVVRRQIR